MQRQKYEYEHVTHSFGPVFDEHAKILILGSMPSVKSREQQFYYGHPKNRFWKVLAAVLAEQVPETTEEKRHLLLRRHVALWDVIASCDIVGSSDSSIKNVKANDMHVILDKADIRAVFVNGGKAYELFRRYCGGCCGREGAPPLIRLPSTSPANAAWSLEKLTDVWKTEMQIYAEELSYKE